VYQLQALFAKRAGIATDEVEAWCTVRFDDDVATHLFAVAAGLESAVMGESEVLGQVRRAWEASHERHRSGPVLAGLFREAVRVGRRARHETAIARGATSFAHAAVAMAARHLDDGLAGRTVTLLGAGDVGAGLLQALVALPPSERPARVLVASRTAARARALVQAVEPDSGVSTVELASAAGALRESDVAFSALDVAAPFVSADDLAPRGGRSGHPILVVDLGVPRNVEQAAADVAGVRVVGMEELKDAVAQVGAERRAEVDAVMTIVEEELDRYRAAVRGRGAAPVIAALRARLEAVRSAEMERQRAALGEEEWRRADEASQAALAKLLHRPTVLLKETAGTPRGERLVEALRALFDL
ncbi:MAG TPA: glutamyl-tRNA reductase, partial [Acidimicrobiia bacterium]|nr:glutamyl-tRNA reductase [Acidimicrobiia bacterium]